jgi:3-oxoacyl-[acyl-carrier protein] reductase
VASDPPATGLPGAGRLEGKVAVVTGGARGIGRAIAEGMAREGALTVIADKVLDEGIAEGTSSIAETYRVDVSVRSEVEDLVDRARDELATDD